MDDHFHRLGLPRRFALEAAELERQYLARSRAVHPDYHAAGSASDLAASLELSAAVNEAYNTLKEPFARAEYLLRLEGGPSAAESKDMPPAFLAEMLDLREQVEAARESGKAGVAALANELEGRYRGMADDLGRLFTAFEASPAGGRAKVLQQVRATLNAARYLRRLIQDLHAD